MRRGIIAAAWIGVVTLPLLLAAVFLIGCCVLPFHGVMHKLMPACEMAAHLMRGGHDDHDNQAQASTPAREEQEPVKRIVSDLVAGVRLPAPAHAHALVPPASVAFRSFITLGALRCDQDVGLHVLIRTLLI